MGGAYRGEALRQGVCEVESCGLTTTYSIRESLTTGPRAGAMPEGHNFKQLQAHILPLSQANAWEVARKEWALLDIDESEEPETCPCGHFPIREICQIRNRITKNVTEVGNVCVKRFLGVRSDLIFTSIKKIRKDRTKSLNTDSIVFFHDRGLLTDWEYGFLQDTLKKRMLSTRQQQVRERINDKVLDAVQKKGFKGPD
jgi:hypothetical protein